VFSDISINADKIISVIKYFKFVAFLVVI